MIWLLASWCLVAVLLAVGLGRSIRAAEGHPGWADGAVQVATTVACGCQGAEGLPCIDDTGHVHRMLAQLERHQPRLAKVVLLCWVGGLSPRAAADTLGVPAAVVEHDLAVAHSLLQHQGETG